MWLIFTEDITSCDGLIFYSVWVKMSNLSLEIMHDQDLSVFLIDRLPLQHTLWFRAQREHLWWRMFGLRLAAGQEKLWNMSVIKRTSMLCLNSMNGNTHSHSDAYGGHRQWKETVQECERKCCWELKSVILGSDLTISCIPSMKEFTAHKSH